jgi:hypothetical protein
MYPYFGEETLYKGQFFPPVFLKTPFVEKGLQRRQSSNKEKIEKRLIFLY